MVRTSISKVVTASASVALIASCQPSSSVEPQRFDAHPAASHTSPARPNLEVERAKSLAPARAGALASPRRQLLQAAPPANDALEAATEIASLPFSGNIDTQSATTGPNDPDNCFSADDPNDPSFQNSSVWYTFTADEAVRLQLDTNGSSYQAAIGVYVMEEGSLTRIACNSTDIFFSEGPTPARLVLDVPADRTLWIMVVDGRQQGGGSLTFNAAVAPVGPSNDQFATPNSLPLGLSDDTDITNAATAFDDPIPGCWGSNLNQTIWHTFTPSQDMSVELRSIDSNYNPVLAVFTGAPGDMTEVACGFEPVRFPVVANQTYYVMSGTMEHQGGTLNRLSIAEFIPLDLEVTVDPMASVNQRTGEVTVTGTFRTNKPANANWNATLRQNQGRALVSGGTFGFIQTVDGLTTWSTTFRSDSILIFGGGQADFSMDVFSQGDNEFVERHVQTQIRVTGKQAR